MRHLTKIIQLSARAEKGRGLGREIVTSLLKNDATVFAVSKTQSKLEELKREFPQVHTRQVDLKNWTETREIVKDIGTIHGLVNNAGLNIADKDSFLSMTPDQFDEVMHTNYRSFINLSQVAVEDMIKRGEGGIIINIGSVGVRIAVAKQMLYSNSKAAVSLMSRVISKEMGKHDIRVNTVHPGLFESDMSKETIKRKGRFYQINMERQHLTRLLTTQDVANVVLFLLSDFSSGITGQDIFVDRGLTSS